MIEKPFNQPQRQSIIGILLIFFSLSYKLFKGLWALLLLIIIKGPADNTLQYILIPLAVGFLLMIVYSYLYYSRFLFHVDYEKEEFVLTKGVFSTEKINLPFDKIQQVDIKRSILQRIIGVYSLTIDTAGSKSNEIQIRALKENDAKSLSNILTEAKVEGSTKDNQEGNTEFKENQKLANTWVYRIGTLGLLKVGLTKGFLRGFIIITTFIFSIYSKIKTNLEDATSLLEEKLTPFIDTNFHNFTLGIFLLIFVLLLSMLVTIGEVFIRYFNLQIKQTAHHIEVEMGLRTNTRITFQPRRLQRLRVRTNPIQQFFNLNEFVFSLASSENDLKNSKISVPGLSIEIIKKGKSFLYDGRLIKLDSFHKPHWLWFRRRILIIFILFSLLISSNLQYDFSNWNLLILISTISFIILVLYQWLLFQKMKFGFTEDFLIVKKGFWTKSEDIIELYKMEGVSIKQPFWYRKRNVYNLKFHTAGGDLTIRAVSDEFVKKINYLLYKVESTNKAWM